MAKHKITKKQLTEYVNKLVEEAIKEYGGMWGDQYSDPEEEELERKKREAMQKKHGEDYGPNAGKPTKPVERDYGPY